jgi:DNA-directed RNA polymerase specialized sigma24 family protein
MTRENVQKIFSIWNCLWNRLRSWLWKSIWPNGPMTPTRSPLTLVCNHLAQLSRSAEGDAAMKRFTEAGADLSGAHDLSSLVHPVGGDGGLRRSRLVEELARLAPRDEVAALCAVVALRPELVWMCRQLAHTPWEPEDADGEVVTAAWGVVRRASRHLRHKALVDDVWIEARRSSGYRRAMLETVPLPEDLDIAIGEVDPTERWPGLLATAVAKGVLTPRQVVLIAQTRMEQRSLREVATSLGRPYDAARMERSRAEAALRQFAASYLLEGSP